VNGVFDENEKTKRDFNSFYFPSENRIVLFLVRPLSNHKHDNVQRVLFKYKTRFVGDNLKNFVRRTKEIFDKSILVVS